MKRYLVDRAHRHRILRISECSTGPGILVGLLGICSLRSDCLSCLQNTGKRGRILVVSRETW